MWGVNHPTLLETQNFMTPCYFGAPFLYSIFLQPFTFYSSYYNDSPSETQIFIFHRVRKNTIRITCQKSRTDRLLPDIASCPSLHFFTRRLKEGCIALDICTQTGQIIGDRYGRIADRQHDPVTGAMSLFQCTVGMKGRKR